MITVIPLTGMGEVVPGSDLADLCVQAVNRAGLELMAGDVVVVAQKVVSKAENQVRSLDDFTPSDRAHEIGARLDRDPRLVEAVLQQSVRVVREERVLIVETHHGYICANAGIDQSNVAGEGMVTLLPEDCDRSAAELRRGLEQRTGVAPAVLISDTFGRPWREGVTDVALGVAGMAPLTDYRGTTDDFGHELQATVVATADQLAAAAELAMGKTGRTPMVLIRGCEVSGTGTGRDLLRPAATDLFR
jgi:coenzyme F420-0:L-glutamate ligase/coenzyme F420-1:gamma-L-glutamate ligase